MHRSSRPASLLGLLLRAAVLRRGWLGALAAAALVPLAFVVARGCLVSPPPLATFNIENYPKSPEQETGAFREIRAAGSKVVALQEITDPSGFCTAAQRELGLTWDCAFTDRPKQRVGLAYDRFAFALLASVVRRETEVYDGAKPALEARLQPHGGGDPLRVFVLHLKAGGDGGPTRARQLAALAPVVSAALGTGDRVVVLGDFNATGPGDVETIAGFARTVGLRFASEQVPCTAYWSRRDGCLGVALDQVLTSFEAEVRAEGPCRTEGCEMRPACPVFHQTVSDHCPVTVGF